MDHYSTRRRTVEPRNTLSQVDVLRQWRDDSLMQHQYRTAENIADKIYTLTKQSDDLYWLAQVHYSTGNWVRAREILFSSAHLQKSVSCRYLAALCLTRVAKWEEALELIGSVNTFHPSNAGSSPSAAGGIKLEASLCFLRGQIYTNLNNFDRARECYVEAVKVDAKCYEAFDILIGNNLLAPKEEWDLLNSLDFEQSCSENAELVRSLYSIRLSKYTSLPDYREAETVLKDDYGLGTNGDVLLAKADLLFVQCRFKQCLQVCEEILKQDKYKLSVMPNYLSCLYELGGRNKLFIIAHDMADEHPLEPMTWLAVGIYYLVINKIPEARRFFSKASIMHPYFSQAWIGFAHTFAIEGEHEQAISAYSTAARLFQGTHLPALFLGMQHLYLHNLTLAQEYLNSSFSICQNDPLLLNELGVVFYHKNDLVTAEKYLLQAMGAASDLDSDPRAWLSIQTNLGHVYRRLELFDRSLDLFEEVLRISPQDSNVHSAMGLVNLQSGKVENAIVNFHDALSITQNDPVATDLLKRALEDSVAHGAFITSLPDNEIDFSDPVFSSLIESNSLSAKSIPNSNHYDEDDSQMDIE